MRRILGLLFLSFILCIGWVGAQNNELLQQKVHLKSGSFAIGKVLDDLAQQTQLNFSYSSTVLDAQETVNLKATNLTLQQALNQLLTPRNLSFVLKGKLLIIQKKKSDNSPNNPQKESQKPKKITISGVVKSKEDGEILIGATVYIAAINKGVYTNDYGFYSLTVPPGNYVLTSSYIGFQNQRKSVQLEKDRFLNIELLNDTTELKEVVVTDKVYSEEIDKFEMSRETLTAEQILSTPTFLGEADVIQSLMTLPGVSSVGELAGSFNVRGGNGDQNLVLMDEATLYNSTHLLGFFSVFNPLSVKDVKLYKGAIPAKYGGRLSSVLDVHQKDGNTKQFSGQGGLGFVAAKLSLEVPLVKDKSSLLIAGRRTFADFVFKLSGDEELENNRFFFYDFNAKFNYKINEKNRLYISGYFGRDVVRLGNIIDFSWGNATTTVRWNHIYNSKLFSNTSLIFSDYNYLLNVPTPTGAIEWRAGITNYQFKNDFTWFISPNNTLDFGVNGMYYGFQPGNVVFSGNNTLNIIDIAKEKAVEAAIYVNHSVEMGSRLSLNYGLRYTHFWKLGPQALRVYRPNAPRVNETVTGTRTFGNNEVIIDYYGLEPRVGLSWKMAKNQILKFNYSRNRQYIHLISNTTIRIPTDIWKASGLHIKPMTSDQLALGYFLNVARQKYRLSAEVYYKRIVDLLEYKSGADLLLNQYPETELIQGNGRAYGLELSLQKREGKLNGWLNYTLARTERQMNGGFSDERINNGEYYPADFDRPHNFKLLLNYQIRKRLRFSLNFIYSSGRPYSLPANKYRYGGDIIVQYAGRNERRLSDYHRLDVSLTLKGKKKPNRRWQGEWIFSVYNVYGRRNTFNIFFELERNTTLTAQKISILGVVFPSVAYHFKF